MIIYRPTDRIPVRIGQVTLHIKPLSNEEQLEINAACKNVGGELQGYNELSLKTLQIAVRDVGGLEDAKYTDGTAVKLEKDGERYTPASIEIIISAIGNNKAQAVSTHIIGGNNPALAAMVEVKAPASKKKP